MRGAGGRLDPPLDSGSNGAPGGSSREAIAGRKDDEASGAQLSRNLCAGQGWDGQARLSGRGGSFWLAQRRHLNYSDSRNSESIQLEYSGARAWCTWILQVHQLSRAGK